jgi:hypothetical protein
VLPAALGEAHAASLEDVEGGMTSKVPYQRSNMLTCGHEHDRKRGAT